MLPLLLQCNEQGIARAATIVREGGVIAYPTDTVYGLGCDPYNEDAVERVFRIKGREEGKAVPLLCASVKDAMRIAYMDERALVLARHFWPGALTILARLKDAKISSRIVKDGKVGVRVPNHEHALRLISLCNGVLVGTSANPSGMSPAVNAMQVMAMLNGLDAILDCGEANIGKASTVYDVEKGMIIREGAIAREELERCLMEYR
ncbi:MULTISPECIES: L-threonylcarbamoyladenylate synthase [Candidatus Nitrosocaldus]|jgi:L-threonylcarbamoyladenylate synthase|uniref:L-threonylcarbamoyladenylate synthase n=1 Tax=Candidatus Nitrosocaldus cavascurensis TaxID=2058097 RepID=A0A2K5AR21_9ARCH|nr:MULTISPECIES: L-threonylcarbamoyladenylate synthase [Candidatus Nitrosocaldus]SPC34098.1 putative Sua5/YciO/YrdC/YwlC family protein [Candidatus Nitrosocaldus cavascurensis]